MATMVNSAAWARRALAANSLHMLILNTDVAIDMTDFCAACEALYPLLNPDVAVRAANRRYELRDRDDMPLELGQTAVRGMYLEAHAAAARAVRCADYLHAKYHDARHVGLLSAELVTLAGKRAAGVLCEHFPGLRAYVTARGALGWTAEYSAPFEGPDARATVESVFQDAYHEDCLQGSLCRSINEPDDAFAECVRLACARYDEGRPGAFSVLSTLFQRTMPLAMAAATTGNELALKIIATTSDLFDNGARPRCFPCRSFEADVIGRMRDYMGRELDDEGIPHVVCAFDTPRFPTHEMYYCAAECACDDRWVATEELTKKVEARGGTQSVPVGMRFQAAYNLAMACAWCQCTQRKISLSLRLLRCQKAKYIASERILEGWLLRCKRKDAGAKAETSSVIHAIEHAQKGDVALP